MRNLNYIKFEERSFYTVLGAGGYAIVIRLYHLYGIEVVVITCGIAIAVLQIIQWVSSFKNRKRNLAK